MLTRREVLVGAIATGASMRIRTAVAKASEPATPVNLVHKRSVRFPLSVCLTGWTKPTIVLWGVSVYTALEALSLSSSSSQTDPPVATTSSHATRGIETHRLFQ
jgi:hypothetical protein